MVRLFCPFVPTADNLVIIFDVVFVIGMAATAAAFVVASTIGISFSVVMCVEFNIMLGIMKFYSISSTPKFILRSKNACDVHIHWVNLLLAIKLNILFFSLSQMRPHK